MVTIVDTDTAVYDELKRRLPDAEIMLMPYENSFAYNVINADNLPCLAPRNDFGVLIQNSYADALSDTYSERTNAVFTSVDALSDFISGRQIWERTPFLQERTRAEVLLRLIGMDDCLSGFSYLAFMTAYLTFVPSASIKYDVMPKMCEYFMQKPDNIERDMRYAAEVTWMRGDISAQQELFGYSVNPKRGKPVVRELCSMLSVTLREQS